MFIADSKEACEACGQPMHPRRIASHRLRCAKVAAQQKQKAEKDAERDASDARLLKWGLIAGVVATPLFWFGVAYLIYRLCR